MKTELIFAGLCLLAATTLRATPDEVVAVEKRFAGANDSTYAILRTETEEGAPETRWISLGLEKSKQLKAQAEPEEE